jgi:hypothetical protein
MEFAYSFVWCLGYAWKGERVVGELEMTRNHNVLDVWRLVPLCLMLVYLE